MRNFAKIKPSQNFRIYSKSAKMVDTASFFRFFQNCFAFLLDPGSITLQGNDIKLADPLHNMSYERLSSNLQLEETRKYLAPNGRLFIQVVPLKVEKDNTEHIIGHDDSTVTYYDSLLFNLPKYC